MYAFASPTDPFLNYRRPVMDDDDDDRRRPWALLLLFTCCLLLCPLLWVLVGVGVSGGGGHDDSTPAPTMAPTPVGGVCCCFDCDGADAELCFAESANQSVCNDQCNVAPMRKRHSVCEVASFVGGGECNASCVAPTPAPPPPPTAEPPQPPGACCCSGCATDRCIEDIDDQEACQAACDAGPPVIAAGHDGGVELQTCAAAISHGETCASSQCTEPLDCCPEDPFVLEGSDYASADPTMCGTHDYNCDAQDDQFPCCYSDKPAPNSHDGRTVYLVSMCQASGGQPLSQNANEVCGACAGQTVVPGWECTLENKRKRFVPPCPSQCSPAEPQLVTPETPPTTGECALFVDRCIGTSGGDGETCCQVVVQ